jgi:hypothetical protein
MQPPSWPTRATDTYFRPLSGQLAHAEPNGQTVRRGSCARTRGPRVSHTAHPLDRCGRLVDNSRGSPAHSHEHGDFLPGGEAGDPPCTCGDLSPPASERLRCATRSVPESRVARVKAPVPVRRVPGTLRGCTAGGTAWKPVGKRHSSGWSSATSCSGAAWPSSVGCSEGWGEAVVSESPSLRLTASASDAVGFVGAVRLRLVSASL